MENDNYNGKDTAKSKIIIFVIGVLFGAVISTSAFFVAVKTLGTGSNANSSSSSQQMQGGTPPDKPSDNNSLNGQGGTPPDMPNNNNSQSDSNN